MWLKTIKGHILQIVDYLRQQFF